MSPAQLRGSSATWQVEFVKSCSALSDLPGEGPSEVALLGRSNVGKSSLLNSLAGRGKLARTSRTPGRTRLLNLFDVNQGQLLLVDCPGYGYAKAGRSLREQWTGLVEQYLSSRRPQLLLALLLVDGCIEPQALDLEAAVWLRAHAIPLGIVATKWDRLSGNQRPLALRRFEAAFAAPVLGYSSVSHAGRDELRKRLLSRA
ncbi:MAG TPA: ribosome biogenesis GTP-binding protein YihA/YsxC [Terriglobales bacterium]|nr:ribosome biogenesis GTP-binding protein YihA/YsxC [Terriglobales bacterium]